MQSCSSWLAVLLTYGCLEGVSVEEVLHGLWAEVDAELLQLAGSAVLEPEHVQHPDEAVRGVAYCIVQYCCTNIKNYNIDFVVFKWRSNKGIQEI